MDIWEFQDAVECLSRHPPGWAPVPERGAALRRIGRFLETMCRPGGPCDLRCAPNPVWNAIEQRLAEALDCVARAVAPKPRLWQMYNAGAVLQDGDATLGVDLVPAPRLFQWPEPPGWTARFARSVNALLLTHGHDDHADPALVHACLENARPVVAPESVAKAWPSHPCLHGVREGERLELAGFRIAVHEADHAWRERLGDVPSVSYEVISPSGLCVLFAGDADYTARFQKTPGARVDLLCLPWRAPNARYEEGSPDAIGTPLDAVRIAVARVRPAGVLLNHYAELQHVYTGFPASYEIALDIQARLGLPCDCLFWGEEAAPLCRLRRADS